jgi:arginase
MFGTQLGPDAMRAAGLIRMLRSTGLDVVDAGNLNLKNQAVSSCATGSVYNLRAVHDSLELVAIKVSEIVCSGRIPLVLGGDHSVAIGSIAGIARHYRSLGLLWYDAHGDSNTPESSPSGYIQGMPVAASLGAGHPELVAVGGYKHKIRPEHVVLVGVRDLDAGERKFLREKNIKIYTSEDMHRRGSAVIMEEAVSYLSSRCDGIHLSCDLDVLDPREASGVGTPVAGGVPLVQHLEAMRCLASHKVVTSAEFVELNPLMDKDGKTIDAAIAMIRAFLGERALEACQA